MHYLAHFRPRKRVSEVGLGLEARTEASSTGAVLGLEATHTSPTLPHIVPSPPLLAPDQMLAESRVYPSSSKIIDSPDIFASTLEDTGPSSDAPPSPKGLQTRLMMMQKLRPGLGKSRVETIMETPEVGRRTPSDGRRSPNRSALIDGGSDIGLGTLGRYRGAKAKLLLYGKTEGDSLTTQSRAGSNDLIVYSSHGSESPSPMGSAKTDRSSTRNDPPGYVFTARDYAYEPSPPSRPGYSPEVTGHLPQGSTLHIHKMIMTYPPRSNYKFTPSAETKSLPTSVIRGKSHHLHPPIHKVFRDHIQSIYDSNHVHLDDKTGILPATVSREIVFNLLALPTGENGPDVDNATGAFSLSSNRAHRHGRRSSFPVNYSSSLGSPSLVGVSDTLLGPTQIGNDTLLPTSFQPPDNLLGRNKRTTRQTHTPSAEQNSSDRTAVISNIMRTLTTTPTSSSKRGLAFPSTLPAILQSPDSSPVKNAAAESTLKPSLLPRTPSDKSRGKRKAEDLERTPPEEREAREAAAFRATLTVPDNRSQRVAPSAFPVQSVKRARISTPPSTPGHHSRATSSHTKRATIDGATIGGGSSSDNRSHSRNASAGRRASYILRPSVDGNMSSMSMPLSAIVSPHAPSIGRPSSKFHMQDPRRPQRLHNTPWSLTVASVEEPGSPLHAWIFFLGFVLFPLWWIASFLPVPKTRHFGTGSDAEKLPLDDPQIEHDAHTWRRRCRWMAGVSLITYIPFIVLIAIFIPRNV